MFLRSLEIKNYRSLEHVKLENLGQFNVLIGRNNSGKSAVFGALALLNDTIHGVGGVDWETVLTAKDKARSLEMHLLFDTRPQDREEFIDLLCAAGQGEGRREAMLSSPLLHQVEFLFKAPAGIPQNLHLRETRMLTEENQWAVVQKMGGDERDNNPLSQMVIIGEEAKRWPSDILHVNRLHVESSAIRSEVRILPHYAAQGQGLFHGDTATRWPLTRLDRYLREAFFFNPFRHSTAKLQAHTADQLAQDGSNLAQVLLTLHSGYEDKFDRIEKFVQSALPDLGRLGTPLIEGNQTEVNFNSKEGVYSVRLHDMGGGIEQLLMIATVLLTTGDECTLFIEEPESHLHAGAQRFLIERLYQGNRQVFVTTHSPTFVNLSRPRSMYQVGYTAGRTTITHLDDAASLSTVLEDIGIRNSDVLLSDAVLFVEGPGDKAALTAWSETLATSLEEHNVTVLPMGGGEHADRRAPIRSEVLAGISQKAPVPHLFVLDRDERSQSEIDKLKKTLGDRVYLLQKRELENYLLVPRALLAAIRSKCHGDTRIVQRIDATTDDEVDKLIQATAESLYGVVLLKRIRAELGGLKGGLLPRDRITALAPQARSADLPQILRKEIESRVKQHLTELNIDGLVRAQREALDREWSDPERRLQIAPGEEIVAAVFHHFGVEYKKPNDTVRIAREMRPDEVPSEIKELVKKAIALTDRTQGR